MHDFENGLFYGNCGIIELTDIENRILNLLIKNKHTVVRYRQIMRKIYKSDEDKELMNTITSNVCRLRQKLRGEVKIKTRRNIGYWIDE